MRYVPGFCLFAIGCVYFFVGIFVTCFLGKADPGATEEPKDAATKAIEGAKKKGKEAVDAGRATVDDTVNQAKGYTAPQPTSSRQQENPFAI